MASTFGLTSPAGPAPESAKTLWQRFAAYLIDRRVRISGIIFFSLILEDVIRGPRPHDLTNFHDVKSMLGLGLVLAGLAVRSWAAGILHKRTQLTTSGPYAMVRHPLYVGSFMMMVGICTLIDDAENIWFVLGPIVGIYLLGIFHEERGLAKHFSGQWQSYAAAVPRFFPRRLPTPGVENWKLGQWIANREYRAVAAGLLGLVAMQVWRAYR